MTDNRIKLILLDFDGTLADTRRANTLAYVTALAEAGYELSEQEYVARFFGMRCNEFLTRFGIADPAAREHIRLRKIALYPTFFDTVQLNRPLWEFCCQFRAQGGRVWIVSTGSRDNIENAMRHLGIATPGEMQAGAEEQGRVQTGGGQAERGQTGGGQAERGQTGGGQAERGQTGGGQAERGQTGGGQAERGQTGGEQTGGVQAGELRYRAAPGAVDGILTGEDVARSKPEPDCFLEAMRREGVTPGQTLIFEDSPIGIEAARRSGAAYFVVKL